MLQKIKKILKNINDSSKLTIKGHFEQGRNCIIENSQIIVGEKGKLILGSDVTITNFKITVSEGTMIVGNHTILQQSNNSLVPRIDIHNGSLIIGSHNLIRADFSIRFSGKCDIGNYNCINELTEIRCDEKITIGDYNMISYECIIYDTNTHVMYVPDVRRSMTIRDFPSIGYECEKPVTKPVSIGNDCWLGKRATVLKGVSIGSNSIVSAACVLTKNVPENHLAYGNPAIIKIRQTEIKTKTD